MSSKPPMPQSVSRVVIEDVEPEIGGGRFPAKRTIGDQVTVTANIFTDGHDHLAARLCHRRLGETTWRYAPMTLLENDLWQGTFAVDELGFHEFTLEAWIDPFASWCGALEKKRAARQDVSSELLEGAALVREAARRSSDTDAAWLEAQADSIGKAGPQETRALLALAPDLALAMSLHPDLRRLATYPRILRIEVERERARFAAWYEMFPRSASPDPSRLGTLNDCVERLSYVASMGFDVLYLPPIHPIGSTHRKGPNNTPGAAPGDPGSPWAIGSKDGGHTALHPALGTMDDFERLVSRCHHHGLEIALDLAFQCSPDHPWVSEHPGWFRHRPDGSIHYAENPPKRYQDIYPLDFDCAEWRSLWAALRDVVLYWVGHGVRIFRVDNPHTKPFAFWEWLIREVRMRHPEVIFLSEAFTRPKIMRYLAKSGFSQSYSYFTWRNTKAELTQYLTELTQSEAHWYMRPNLFTNTPDILHEVLQIGGRAAFQTRLILAATLGASYGIYGPPFELCVGEALPGTEEYKDSEKYQQRTWDLDDPGSLRALITLLNRIRRENLALQHDERLRFHPVDNDQLLFYSKSTSDLGNVMLMVVNLDPRHMQAGWVDVPLGLLELGADEEYQVHDLLGDARYVWRGARNYVALDPGAMPAHVLRLHRRQTERNFDPFA